MIKKSEREALFGLHIEGSFEGLLSKKQVLKRLANDSHMMHTMRVYQLIEVHSPEHRITKIPIE